MNNLRGADWTSELAIIADHCSTYGLWGIGLLGTGAGLAFISSCIYACCALSNNPHCVYRTPRQPQVSYRNKDIITNNTRCAVAMGAETK